MTAIEQSIPRFRLGIAAAEEAHRDAEDRDAIEMAEYGNPLQQAAVECCQKGFAVIALEPRGKAPVSKGVTSATTRPSVAYSRFEDPDLNIGIVTGSISGLLGIDIDGPQGRESWAKRWEGGAEPVTREVSTGRDDGGHHLYFRIPPGAPPLRGGNDRLGPGVDVKAENAYLVAPPSIHESGRHYAWRDEHVELANLPDELVKVLQAPTTTASSPSPARIEGAMTSNWGTSTPWGKAALRSTCAELARCPEGGRDDMANRMYFKIGQIVAGGQLCEQQALEALARAMDANGLGRHVAKMPAFLKGMESPRCPESDDDRVTG